MSTSTEPNRSDGENSSQKTSESDSEEDAGVKRVNITMHSLLHTEYTDFADKQGMTFSELVRRSLARYKDQEEEDDQREEDGTRGQIQPLQVEIRQQREKLESQAEQTAEIHEMIDEFVDKIEATANDSTTTDQSDETLAKLLRQQLKDKGPLSIPKLTEVTDLTRGEVERGLNRLRDSHAIRKVESDEARQKWRCV
jgi:septal ring factor EnvC (AmiA/AmiB activator)